MLGGHRDGILGNSSIFAYTLSQHTQYLMPQILQICRIIHWNVGYRFFINNQIYFIVGSLIIFSLTQMEQPSNEPTQRFRPTAAGLNKQKNTIKVNLMEKQFLITQTNKLIFRVFYILQVEAFCDVTLAVDGASIKCHKMVRSNHQSLAKPKDSLYIKKLYVLRGQMPQNGKKQPIHIGRIERPSCHNISQLSARK